MSSNNRSTLLHFMEFNMSEVIQTRNYTGVTTSDIVIEMLKENTGSALCDSGGAYGRNHERNAKREFPDRPVVKARFSAWRRGDVESGPRQCEPDVSISLYHWMVGCLDFDAEMQAELDEFAAREENEDEHWLSLSESFANYLHERDGHGRAPNVINTYNDPDNWDCDQVLQYTEVYTDSDYEPSHLIVNVHGGCDVLGGYTAPKCFRLSEDYYTALDKARVNMLATDNLNWRYEDSCWRYCDTEGYIPDVMALPCYDIDWLDEVPEIAEIQARIADIPRQRQQLEQGTVSFTATQVEGALSLLDLRLVELEGELFEAAAYHLSTLHEECTMVHEHRLFLIEGPGQCGEVKAYNDL